MISLSGIRLKGGWLVLALEIKAIQQNPFWVLVVCFVLSRYGKWFYILCYWPFHFLNPLHFASCQTETESESDCFENQRVAAQVLKKRVILEVFYNEI